MLGTIFMTNIGGLTCLHRIRSTRQQEPSTTTSQDSEKGSETAIGSSSDVKLSQLDLEPPSPRYITAHVQPTILPVHSIHSGLDDDDASSSTTPSIISGFDKRTVGSRESLGTQSFGEARSYDEDLYFEDDDPNLDENAVRVGTWK